MNTVWPSMRSLRDQPVGCEAGQALIMRCPRVLMVSTPQSLWEQDPCADSLPCTLGRTITAADERRQIQIESVDPVMRAMRAAMRAERAERRRRTLLRERDEKRTYAAIGREHGVTRERARQIVLRAREALEHADTESAQRQAARGNRPLSRVEQSVLERPARQLDTA
jgi:hypothetical protein